MYVCKWVCVQPSVYLTTFAFTYLPTSKTQFYENLAFSFILSRFRYNAQL